ncbi:MAG: sigma-70 family RNA polymerase sigma factor [Clostridiales bacterium]|nr:sigma-70 family RNA polymerase sigma factor [Clostridiales bacterium]
MAKHSDTALLSLIRSSPEQGLREAVEQYGGAVATICKNILFDCPGEDVEEAVSDCFFELWQSAGRFSPDSGGSLKSYLYGIARHTALDRRRRLYQKPPPLSLEEMMVDEGFDLETEFIQKRNQDILHQCIRSMQEPARSIFLLRYFYFFRVKAIAERLNLPEKKVENCLYRERDRLKQALIKGGIAI